MNAKEKMCQNALVAGFPLSIDYRGKVGKMVLRFVYFFIIVITIIIVSTIMRVKLEGKRKSIVDILGKMH